MLRLARNQTYDSLKVTVADDGTAANVVWTIEGDADVPPYYITLNNGTADVRTATAASVKVKGLTDTAAPVLIKATYTADNASFVDYCAVTVKEIVLDDVSITSSGNIDLRTVLHTFDSNVGTATFTSSDSDVATITGSTLTGVAAGECTVVVSYLSGGVYYYATCKVMVS